ncbi:MAG: DNA polymerase III subunit beta [Rhodobiaceae bacterium]|nr:DNA polymerase III subunit beta [Rhodobiaceae bacterium]
MKISIERDILLKGLNHVHSVVERRNTIPVLSNVKIKADEEGISLTATDLDLEIIENLKANTLDAGVTTASAHTLYDIVRKLPEGSQIDIEKNENNLIILNCGQSNFELSTLPDEDFPEMSSGEMPCNFTIGSKDFAKIIDKSRFAISTEETRYYLNGIFLHAIDGNLRGVATDGHRLACILSDLPKGADEMPSIIIPRKTISEIRKLIEDTEGDISLKISDTKIQFNVENVTLTSKLIDGTFPDYERVIPKTNTKVMSVETKTFSSSIDRVATISSDKSKAVKFFIESNLLTLTVVNPEAGTAVEKMLVEYKSDSLEVGFNARYLLDIASQIDGDNMTFTLEDPGAPALIKDSAHEEATYVLMPMRV